jgi:hypothetical protein
MAYADGYLYAGGNFTLAENIPVGRLARYNIVATDIASIVKTVPENFTLYQNYPNPFNPVTAIRYQLAVNGKVSLKVFNLLGQEVATLVDSYQQAGNYELRWQGANNLGQKVASGVYLYRLESAGMVQSRKMVLMK